MAQIEVKFEDGKKSAFPAGTAVRDIIASWRKDVLDSAVAARVNGDLLDLSRPLDRGGTLEVIDVKTPEGLGILRHSISHVMAQAVQDAFKGVKVTIGPSIEDGFYYDFDYETTFTPDDLKKIEERMKEIVSRDLPFVRREVSRKEAVDLFSE